MQECPNTPIFEKKLSWASQKSNSARKSILVSIRASYHVQRLATKIKSKTHEHKVNFLHFLHVSLTFKTLKDHFWEVILLFIQLHVSLIEAQRQEQINHANGEAAAMIAVAEARANGLTVIAKS